MGIKRLDVNSGINFCEVPTLVLLFAAQTTILILNTTKNIMVWNMILKIMLWFKKIKTFQNNECYKMSLH